MPAKTAPDTLTGHAAEIWEAAYESAWDQYDSEKHGDSREEYASKVAWGAVKNDYRKNKEGNWVKKSLANVDFRLRITKSRLDEKMGRIKWHAQAAYTEAEAVDEVLHPTLFDDLANNFNVVTGAYERGHGIPDFGYGPANYPILDIAHYSALLKESDRDAARLGNITKLYRDGTYLHAEGYFDDTPQAQMAANAIQQDKDGELRVSVGFYPDWGNIEIKNDVLYLKGGRDQAYLDHLAITSVPKIPLTTIDVTEEELMSDVATLAQDAAKILGEGEEANAVVSNLEELVDKHLKNESMVMLSDESDEELSEEKAEVIQESDVVIEDENDEGTEVVEEVTETEKPVGESVEMAKKEDPDEEKDEEEEMQLEKILAKVEAGKDLTDEEKKMLDRAKSILFSEPEEEKEDLSRYSLAIALEQYSDVTDTWQVMQDLIDEITKSDIENKSDVIQAVLVEYRELSDVNSEVVEEIEEVEDGIEEEQSEDVVEEELPKSSTFSNGDVQVQRPVQGAKSFGDVAAMLERRPTGTARTPRPQPNNLSTTDQKSVIEQSDVQALASQMIQEALEPLMVELNTLRRAVEERHVVKEEPTAPSSPQRRSNVPELSLRPAQVTERAKTFNDVVERLWQKRGSQ